MNDVVTLDHFQGLKGQLWAFSYVLTPTTHMVHKTHVVTMVHIDIGIHI